MELTPSQLGLVKRTIAKDCNKEEFDLFMAAAKSYGLDPFRKQILPLIFSKDNPKKRRMSIVVSRDGLRLIAQRCGNYRPASEKAEIVYDENLISPANPKGIVSAMVRLHQRDQSGNWFPVIGEAYWDEFAPLKTQVKWVDTGEVWPDSGKPKMKAETVKGSQVLDDTGQWAKMPVVMITKCAEAQALRAGWPDQFGSIYAEEEMHQASATDVTASEAVDAEDERLRMERISGERTILTMMNNVMERLQIGEFYDRCVEHIGKLEPDEAYAWSVQNREPLKEFWAHEPNDALELKKAIESRVDKMGQAA